MTQHYKDRARRLRAALAAREHAVTHSEALELVAQEMGRRNWNALAAEHGRDNPSLLDLPADWHLVRSPGWEGYAFGADPETPGVLVIRSLGVPLPAHAFGSVMLSERTLPPQGTRFVLQACLATCEAGAAVIWLRIDAADGRVLAFDNLMRPGTTFRGLSGTRDWTDLAVCLPVQEGAASVHYGVLLKGEGEIRARDIRLTTDPTSDGRDAPVPARV